jgi:hypothetical protein
MLSDLQLIRKECEVDNDTRPDECRDQNAFEPVIFFALLVKIERDEVGCNTQADIHFF